jgi:oligogalacturonide lyase
VSPPPRLTSPGPLPERLLPVRRLVAAPGINHHPYFYSPAFSPDERHLAFGSDRSGAFQIWSLDLATGRERQLTDTPSTNTQSMSFGWSGPEIYFVRENRIWAVHPATAALRLVTDYRPLCADHDQHTRPVFPRDMSRLYFHYHRPDGAPAIGCADPRGGPPRELAAFPELERIVHVLVHPFDPDFVTFDPFPDRQEAWTLGPRERARCWRFDPRTAHTTPFLVAPPGPRATHEFWSPDGARLYHHRKTVPGWTPVSIASIARDGTDLRIHFTTTEWRLGHGNVSPDGRWLVTDAQDPGRNPLILVELATGQASIVAWPDASGAAHPRHVHPSFSPSGRWLVYTSDVSGDAHVCTLDLHAAGLLP